MFVDTLWEVLDGDDDERLVSASTGPLDPTDRVAHKVHQAVPRLMLTPHLSHLTSPSPSPHLTITSRHHHLTSPHLTLTSPSPHPHLMLTTVPPLSQALVNLLNVLSAFPAVYEALNCPPQHHSTSTVLGLLKKMALWEGEERGRGLVSPEDAHLCGLRFVHESVS